MKTGLGITLISLISFLPAICQVNTDINKTDSLGRKQGTWIKKYPNGTVMYEGFFIDDHPAGEFKRYYENSTLQSLFIYSDDGTEVTATIYHTNGFIASTGKYINMKKEGKWKFYSAYDEGYLISADYYSEDIRNGPSVKYYPDEVVAEKLFYKNGLRNGEWIQYYRDGSLNIKSQFINDKLEGKFEAWYDNGQIEFSGQYKNNARDGTWLIYNRDSTLKYKIEYREGYTENRQIRIDGSDYLDSLEKAGRNITDPEIYGITR